MNKMEKIMYLSKTVIMVLVGILFLECLDRVFDADLYGIISHFFSTSIAELIQTQ